MVLLFMQDHGYGGKIAGFLGGVVVGAFIGAGIIPGGTVPGAFSIGVVGTATDAVGSYFILGRVNTRARSRQQKQKAGSPGK